MEILFMGTPEYALECLKTLYNNGENIKAVFTQPDKPRGRGYRLLPPPVKVFAEENGIPVYQPDTLKSSEAEELLKEISPELIVVAAYGKILPSYVIDYPKYGCINAHASILPEYRGAAPIQRAIMDGRRITGITAMYMNEGVDTGDIILIETVEILPTDDFGSLHDKLAAKSGVAIQKAIEKIRDGTITRIKQDNEKATYAAKITKEDCLIDFTRPAYEVYNKIRALSPSPLAYTETADGKLLKITSSKICDGVARSAAGFVSSFDAEGFFVSCGEGEVKICGVLPEGKGRMSAGDFIRGRKISVGDKLGKID